MKAAAADRERTDAHLARFERCFGGGGGVRLFFAPGRVNLMGAHLDYNGGPVMPMAIDRGTLQQMATVAAVLTLPILLVVYFLQRYLRPGALSGAVKG